MKKLSKISLSGDVSLLSTDDLKQLIGSAGFDDVCVRLNEVQCNGTRCDVEGRAGTCQLVVYKAANFKGCLCFPGYYHNKK